MATWTLPAPDLARPAFGGTALDRLMVASADGRLFALDVPGVRGIADTPFDDGLPDR
jgi:sugar lactone lactonase YvrE